VRKAWRVAGLCCAVMSVIVWLALGANRGWTKTTHTHMEKDPVTEIEYPRVEKKFSPGVEFLAGGLLLSVALAGVSLFVRKTPTELEP
jgi:hypothetical protein